MRSNQRDTGHRKPLVAAMRTDLRDYRRTAPMVVTIIKKKKVAKRDKVAASGRKT